MNEYLGPAHARRVLEICDKAIELDAAERECFVAKTCGDDAKLLAVVESTLRAVDESESFLALDDGAKRRE